MTSGSVLLRRRLPVLVHGVARDRGGRGRGRRRDRVAARSSCGPRRSPLLEVRGDHLRVDWTQNVYRRALERRHRDPPAALPAALDADALRVPLGRRAGPPARASSTRSTRRSSARARTSPPTREIARAAERAGLDPDGAIAAAYSPERGAQLRADPRARPRRRACAACRRSSPRAARRHWGMGGLSGCSPASRSCPEPA